MSVSENVIKYAQTYKQVAEEEGREGRHNAVASVYTQKHSIKVHVVYGMWKKRLSCLGLILYSEIEKVSWRLLNVSSVCPVMDTWPVQGLFLPLLWSVSLICQASLKAVY